MEHFNGTASAELHYFLVMLFLFQYFTKVNFGIFLFDILKIPKTLQFRKFQRIYIKRVKRCLNEFDDFYETAIRKKTGKFTKQRL